MSISAASKWTRLGLSIAVASMAVIAGKSSPTQAVASQTVTVGPIDSTTNSASNFDADGKWTGDGAINVPITFTGFDAISSLFVSINAPEGGAISIDSTGLGASIQRAFGYGSWTSLPTISFFGTRADVSALLASKVTYVPPSNGSTYNVKVTITEYSADLYFNPVNEHYYRPVTLGSNITWTDAKVAAEGSSYNGLTGYLATLTSRSENDFTRNYVGVQNIWIGANDHTTEGTWRWETGPEAGTTFWTGQGASGTVAANSFAYWAKGEPNDFFGEDYAVTNFGDLNGRWNDFPNTHAIKSYLIEYGGIGTFSGIRAVGTASVTTSNPFTIGTMSGATFTAGDIVWSSSATKNFAINVSRFGSATSTNFTATLTLKDSASMGTLTMATTTGLTLNTGFSSFTGQTAIGFTGLKADVIAALKNLRWNTPASRKDLEIEVALGETDTDIYLNPSNGHYYKMVNNGSNIAWDWARVFAQLNSYKSMKGYLATITTNAENEFVKGKIPGTSVWIGASDNETFVNDASMIRRDNTEGKWTWVTGPEAGTQFWEGASGGALVSGQYASWRTGEPNNSSDACGLFQSCNYRDEDYAYTNASGALGKWNDVYAGSGVTRYLVEFGGSANEASTAKSAVDVVGLGRVPTAPQSVSSASNSPRTATISWSAPSDAGNRAITGYTVTAFNGSNNVAIAGATCTTASTSCNISGIMTNTAKFKVVATNSVGTGPSSALTSATNILNYGEPGSPTNVIASVAGGVVTVSWTAPTDLGTTALTGYTVTSSPSGGTCTVLLTSCTVSGLTSSTLYTFTVVATNSGGSSLVSSPSVAITPNTSTSAPSSPTDLVVTISSSGSATVSFTPPTSNGSSDITSYTITASPGGASCTAYPPATSCTIAGLDPTVSYSFSATASNGNGSSSSSTSSLQMHAGTITQVPGSPTGLQASVAANGNVTVKFDGPIFTGTTSISQYIVTAFDANSTAIKTCSVSAPTTTCAFTTGLNSADSYQFGAQARNGNGDSALSILSVPVSPGTPTSVPSAPTNVGVSVDANGIATVVFTPPATTGTSSITEYTATAYDGNNNAIPGAVCVTVTNSCVISTIPAGTTFTVKVVASNGNGDSPSSAASVSNNVSVATTAPEAPRQVLASVAANGNVTVSFTPGNSGSGAITSYTVSAINASGIVVATCTAYPPATSCEFIGLNGSQNYTFSVVADSAYGSSGFSTQSIAVDPATPTSVPAAPTNPVATVTSSGTVNVSFNVPSSSGSSAIAWYVVTAYNADGTVAGTCTAQAPATSCSISGLSPTGSYSFGVAAVNGNGVSTSSSRTPSLKPVTSTTSGTQNTSASTPSAAPASSVGVNPSTKPTSRSSFRVKVGDSFHLMNAPVNIDISGLKPGSEVIGVVFSTPRVFGKLTVGASGRVKGTLYLPSDLEPGDHKILIKTTAKDGSPYTEQINFKLDADGKLVSKTEPFTMLPRTGTPFVASVMWAMALVFLGAVMIILLRRRNLRDA